MRKVTETELKQINLELLLFFDKVCREHGIKYSITGGTLLGAIRHKGFIPWDDDVDVFLPRPEYEKLNHLFSTDDRYIWKTRTTDPKFGFVYGRLLDTKTIILNTDSKASEGQGVFLDVCVIDGLPKREIFRRLHIFYIQLLFRARRSMVVDHTRPEYNEKNVLIRMIKKVITATTDIEFWMKRLEKAMRKYAFDNSDYVGNFATNYGKKELMHRKSFDSYTELEFEGYKLMACVGWEEYLKNIYGDYMKLPPKEQQIGHHIGEVFWID